MLDSRPFAVELVNLVYPAKLCGALTRCALEPPPDEDRYHPMPPAAASTTTAPTMSPVRSALDRVGGGGGGIHGAAPYGPAGGYGYGACGGYGEG
jgi:hypothetical protein